ncbi:hypothetical protein CC78DRAFT_533040 [Lojkania enalia]|uniref:Uncharacterized protein n=1 Tax=Lojkania enalia TaxID=147567 RepID=A0A9P4KBL7_9PLEO|nr:hypothetical protein CC78DRAFT_533040 [Didymosphaeria enalia]
MENLDSFNATAVYPYSIVTSSGSSHQHAPPGLAASDLPLNFSSHDQEDSEQLWELFPNTRRDYLPGSQIDDKQKWNKCRLLSLPKEIRLHIWEHVLTNPSIPELAVWIIRKPSSPLYKLTHPPPPLFGTRLEPSRRSPVNTMILLANRFIYEEALPVLYSTANFIPGDLEGLWPLFTNTLSPYARSCIRRIRLFSPLNNGTRHGNDRSRAFFHWAVTCAQVALLSNTLREVEIYGDWSIFEVRSNHRALLYPLCKIKTKKKFYPIGSRAECHPELQNMFKQFLAEAGEELKRSASVREANAKAARSPLRTVRPRHDATKLIEPMHALIGYSMEDWCRFAEENLKRIDRDLSSVKGIQQFEKELSEHSRSAQNRNDAITTPQESSPTAEEWDMVSMKSGAFTPRARSFSMLSTTSKEEWVDTVSTLVAKEDVGNGDTSDGDSEGWEYVEK